MDFFRIRSELTDAYKDKETGSVLEPKQPLLVKYVQEIIHQGSDILYVL